jgi:Mlc titration factor MtfA (ptsG expression regulator)
MLFAWLKKNRRRKIVGAPFPEHLRQNLTDELAHYPRLETAEQRQLEGIIQILMAEKDWVGCGGLELTERIKALIAAQAGTLLLGLEHDYYRNISTVLIYPSGYAIEGAGPMDILAPADRAVLGHAQLRGPVVLSWQHAQAGGRDADDGKNLVYHEFAHKLDMLDGVVDGTPIMADQRALAEWVQVMTKAYESLQRDAKKGRRSVLDHYGATDVGEFFACATEAFFERACKMNAQAPALYGVLKGFYGQDPANWRH